MTYDDDSGGLATGWVRSNCCDDILNLINHNLDTTIVFSDHSPPTHRAIMINSLQHQTHNSKSLASFLRDIAGWWISEWHPGEQQEMAGQDELLPATQFRDVSIFTIIYNTKLSDPCITNWSCSALLDRTGHIKLKSNDDLGLKLITMFLVKYVNILGQNRSFLQKIRLNLGIMLLLSPSATHVYQFTRFNCSNKIAIRKVSNLSWIKMFYLFILSKSHFADRLPAVKKDFSSSRPRPRPPGIVGNYCKADQNIY